MTERFLISPRTLIGKEAWDFFVDASGEAWLWHRYDLQDALAVWPGRQDMSFAVLGLDGKIIAVLPLQIIRQQYFRVVSFSQLESLGGLAICNGLSRKESLLLKMYVQQHLLALAKHHHALEIGFSICPMAPMLRGENCPRVNPLLQMGCENSLTQTWVIDIRKGKDAIWQAMEGRARTAVRKAEKVGVRVRPADQLRDPEIYFRLHSETYQRTGVRPHPKEYFEAIWKNFYGNGYAQIWFAELEGQVVAAENFGIYKNAAIYWTGAASAKGLEVEANSLLQWKAMEWMMENNIEWYETGEAFPNALSGKSKGLSDFKKSFGGELYPLFRGVIQVAPIKCKGLGLARELLKWQRK